MSSNTGGSAVGKRKRREVTETVEVIAMNSDGKMQLIETLPLDLLLRFSGVARSKFLENEPDYGERKEAERTAWPEGVEGKPSTVGASGAELSVSDSPKRLTLGLSVSYQPLVENLEKIAAWMLENQSAGPDEEPEHFGSGELADMPFQTLIELYAATLAFQLIPKSSMLRKEIKWRISSDPPSASDVAIITKRVPCEDSVIMRLIMSYTDHKEKGTYDDEELVNIQYYFEAVPQLNLNLEKMRWDRELARDRYRDFEYKSPPWYH